VSPQEKHRVCQNALVLGLTPWPGGQPYVTPEFRPPLVSAERLLTAHQLDKRLPEAAMTPPSG
jgi:hypothetical protein